MPRLPKRAKERERERKRCAQRHKLIQAWPKLQASLVRTRSLAPGGGTPSTARFVGVAVAVVVDAGAKHTEMGNVTGRVALREDKIDAASRQAGAVASQCFVGFKNPRGCVHLTRRPRRESARWLAAREVDGRGVRRERRGSRTL
ncbi:hypothetical protein FA10DRAFT_55582 [Acaromyces ingoldii]|uniref:Uncharacterized protein n=1 Tax=Acaromyces ingoldii TaxID=215250 RepID=A0A316YAE1_9BASI|nr:hypothetical protein FA10DRAFT_55582 [Acaromyces ingoldii]PWN86626.1 hypothetical protein FA10DRAFT_55582 [Acaromyces ingoldii]